MDGLKYFVLFNLDQARAQYGYEGMLCDRLLACWLNGKAIVSPVEISSDRKSVDRVRRQLQGGAELAERIMENSGLRFHFTGPYVGKYEDDSQNRVSAKFVNPRVRFCHRHHEFNRIDCNKHLIEALSELGPNVQPVTAGIR